MGAFKEAYLKVTSENRKEWMAIGRRFHVIAPQDHSWVSLRGFIIIRPRLEGKRFIKFSGERVWIHEEETTDDWAASFNSVITFWIDKGYLYVRPEESLTVFEYE